MALNSTLYRFKISLSDVTRGIYETLEMRVPMHPSEASPFFLTRILAYCLNFQRGIEFSQGISSPDEPAIQVKDDTGQLKLWIDVGNPSGRRLHKASKACPLVKVYTFRDPALLLNELRSGEVKQSEKIEVFSMTASFLEELGAFLERDNNWEFLHTDGEVSISNSLNAASGEISRHSF